MRQSRLFVAVVVLLLLVGLLVVACFVVFDGGVGQRPFFVGVTYCGSSVEEARVLVDQVKGCTNLFVLQTGTLQTSAEVFEIGDYAIASGLSFSVYLSDKVYYSFDASGGTNEWVNVAKERWGECFVGIYYRDEPGGDMLDGKLVNLEKAGYQIHEDRTLTALIPKVTKYRDVITVYNRVDSGEGGVGNVTSMVGYWSDGRVEVTVYSRPFSDVIRYFPNGTVIISRGLWPGFRVSDVYVAENLTEYPLPVLSYAEVLRQNPVQSCDDAADAFVNMHKDFFVDIDKKQLNSKDISVFTADYGLYWWDYQGGYDMVLAELGWNNSVTREIGLVRGAANLYGKSWGTILTWKYTHAPYLTDGGEMFGQMKTSYEAGADYVIIFNYSEDPVNPNTLQEEHFLALERFWTEVVENSEVIHGGIAAEAAFVLPKNYGWGMRARDDNLWGLWPADETTVEFWNQLQEKIEHHGLKLDIVFDDPNYSAMWKYPTIYHWNKK